MTLDRKAIETISVNAVRNSIVTSPFLDQFIADNDKEPSWDGNVYIYKYATKKDNILKGRMPVQVKGKVCNDFSADEISYSMKVTDLTNYLYDGGVVLFVVYINETTMESQIYYSELAPLKLRAVLNEAKGQKYKTVKLKRFPDDKNRKATIFLNCLQNCQKQASFTDAQLHSIEELEKAGILEGLTIPLAGAGIFDPMTALFTSETYLYAVIKGSSIPEPLELLPNPLFVEEDVLKEVVIDGTVHYSKYRVIRHKKDSTVQFGESFQIIFEDGTPGSKIKYKNSSRLRTLAKDLSFFLEYFDKGYFQINDTKFPFDKGNATFNNFDIEKQRQRLRFAKRSVCVLDILGCKQDLDITKLSPRDIRNLEILATAFIDKKVVSGLNPDLPPVILMPVADLKFALTLKSGETEGEYYIFDFFRTEMSIAYKDTDGKMIPTSQYTILRAEDILLIQNLQPEVFLPSFQKIQVDDKYIRANWFLLVLLEAYDKSNDTRKDLLQSADAFSEWLLEAPEQFLDSHLKYLNRLQVLKRIRALNIDEVAGLWDIIEDDSATDADKLGAYLLLDQQIPATRCLEKLSKEDQAQFRTFPIFRYYKTAEENENGQA